MSIKREKRWDGKLDSEIVCDLCGKKVKTLYAGSENGITCTIKACLECLEARPDY